MRVTRALLVPAIMLAVALSPAAQAVASDDITWPQVQGAARQAQLLMTQGGGTATVVIASKISYRQRTDYQPGGAVTREAYREAGMSDSEPDEITWTITRKGATTRYQRRPVIPKPGRYPTLRTSSWVRLNPSQAPVSTPPGNALLTYDPLAEIASSTNDAGVVMASWTHGVDGKPDSAVTATFSRQPSGALVLTSFTTKDLFPTGPGFTQSVQLVYANPRLVVPNVRFALPKDYVDAAMHAGDNTTLARYSVVNAASDARRQAETLTRPELIDYARTQVQTWQDFGHPPSNPSTDTVTNVPDGVRVTNHNAYSGQTTAWTLVVTPDSRVVVTRRAKASSVTPIP